MIELLKKTDIEEAAKVFNHGLQMEIPKGYATLDETIERLKNVITFVYKENQKIKGLISFGFKEKGKIKVDFICALALRKGIGTILMEKLADFSIKNNIIFIYSRISSKDKRAIKFYGHCGFKKYGEHAVAKDFMLYKVKAEPRLVKEAINNSGSKL